MNIPDREDEAFTNKQPQLRQMTCSIPLEENR